MSFLDIQLRSYRSDDYISRLYFESNRIRCGQDEWVMKAFISCCDQNPQNPTISMDRSLTFQLILKNRPNFPKDLQFFVTRSPSSDFQVNYFLRKLNCIKFYFTSVKVIFQEIILRLITWPTSIALPITLWSPLLSRYRLHLPPKSTASLLQNL